MALPQYNKDKEELNKILKDETQTLPGSVSINYFLARDVKNLATLVRKEEDEDIPSQFITGCARAFFTTGPLLALGYGFEGAGIVMLLGVYFGFEEMNEYLKREKIVIQRQDEFDAEQKQNAHGYRFISQYKHNKNGIPLLGLPKE